MKRFLLLLSLVSVCLALGPLVPTLLVPPTAPTRHQLIWGVGIPLDLNFESLVFGAVLKAQYYLADQLNLLKPSAFPGVFPETGASSAGRGRREAEGRCENYTVEVEEIEEATLRNMEREERIFEEMKRGEHEGVSRWDVYSGLEGLVRQQNFGDRECILRAICDAATTSFSPHSGLLAELVHIILTPSTTPDPLSKHSDNEYLHAEHIGRSNGNCEFIFPNCKGSLLDMFTGIHDPLSYEMDDTVKERHE